MSDRLTRSSLKRIILEEKRAITRKLIAEGGCGCGGCSTCAQNMMKIIGDGMHEDDAHEGEDALVITYDDSGMPAPSNYDDYESVTGYPFGDDEDDDHHHGKNVTMGGRDKTGHDITHGDDYGQSYMAKQHINTIIKSAKTLDSMIHGDEELEDWCESKLSVAASMLQAVANFVSYHKGASHTAAESYSPSYGVRNLMRVLEDE
jgi:hypothetical protein